ncbi:hypothetical protein AB0I81_23705 [Nonomuraea sp. NPDC050404]|uniref:hypothetical protein n=1 Tax=Nonomuraea sp. NPDC050404 TaxID=3155783 RepID=UPI0033D24188
MTDIDHLIRAIDPAPHAPEQGPGARELRAAILAAEPEPHRPSRLPGLFGRFGRARGTVLLAAATAVAAAVAIGVGLPAAGPATEYANAAVSIKKAPDHFSVTITDPAADRRSFEEAFREVGLNVTVKVVPVAPQDVGKLLGPVVPEGFRWHGSIGVQYVAPCASAFCGKVWMPADFPGRVVLGVGRPAKPGEPYADDTLYDKSGEECLNGYQARGKTVGAVRAEVRRHGLKSAHRLLWTLPDDSFFDAAVPADRVKDDWTVNGCRAISSDTIDIYVNPGPGAGPAPDPLTVRRPEWYDDTTS